MVEKLVALGADLEAKNHNEHTALALAVEIADPKRRLEVVRTLVDLGASPDVLAGHHGGTVLHRAIIANDAATAELLLVAGADATAGDRSGKTALHHAISRNVGLVELVLKYAPQCATVVGAASPLEYARRLRKKKAAALIEGLC